MGKQPQTQAYTEAECRAFVDAASPYQWLQCASNLHEQALQLYAKRGSSLLTLRAAGRPDVTWDSTNKATFLLCAFALENALKAFLIYEHPEFIAGGRLARELRSHKLTELASKSSYIPYRQRGAWVLEAFEQGNDSWMRYPCGRNASDIRPEGQLSERLWRGYRVVMRGYGVRLNRLFLNYWDGPFGRYGKLVSTTNLLGDLM